MEAGSNEIISGTLSRSSEYLSRRFWTTVLTRPVVSGGIHLCVCVNHRASTLQSLEHTSSGECFVCLSLDVGIRLLCLPGMRCCFHAFIIQQAASLCHQYGQSQVANCMPVFVRSMLAGMGQRCIHKQNMLARAADTCMSTPSMHAWKSVECVHVRVGDACFSRACMHEQLGF